MKPFVEGWFIQCTLGEGAFGEVQLLTHQNGRDTVACKVLDTTSSEDAEEKIRKEKYIHKRLKHPNIIKYYGSRQQDNIHYIFLEYASGGELYDRIEPDVGMPECYAHKYFSQLIASLEYIHSMGIVHRDIKPENLLLDKNDNLKLADFGLATLFRHLGKERLIQNRCGTLPYMAPEVLEPPYRAEATDCWSAGIVLAAMLTGNLPWDSPQDSSPEFKSWRDEHKRPECWNRISPLVLALLEKMMTIDPNGRYTLSHIQKNKWFTRSFSHSHKGVSSHRHSPRSKRICSGCKHGSSHITKDEVPMFSFSQPERTLVTDEIAVPEGLDSLISFSQPARAEDLLLSSQMQPDQDGRDFLEKLVKRMTRFAVNLSMEESQPEIKSTLEGMGYAVRCLETHQLTCSTIDCRKMQLIFKVNILPMKQEVLADFRLSKGDGLEFKRHFILIREALKDIIISQD